ncbi:type II toxin-antitoxin system RelE/ParE family toxin [Ciceribacter sp. L1K22]|nr:type II toxin-antitoxin system RelE/ParE family toxin [Ciceribacter sp. L1K22]MBO3759549.1 type II toxin-antitoxin system RelE/ParE family toxin [Ciceribacter sp. L1K22]
MRRLRYLESAKADLLNIMTYIASQSGDVALARSFVDRLRARCRNLASLPGELGRPRPELRTDVRSFAYRGYVIFFRYVDDVLEVVAVLEGHRDIDNHFGEDG